MIIHSHGNANDAWQSSEDMELVNGKTYNIINGSGNAVEMLSLTQIGPASGSGVATLGTGVTGSSLTSVGTLTALEVSGVVNFTGTSHILIPAGTDAQQPGQTGQATAVEGMLRYNTDSDSFEGYDGANWGKIGGGAAVQSAAPSSANPGDLWYDTDDGRMFVYYTDANSSQWVDASPNGIPTDLTVEGATVLKGSVQVLNNDPLLDLKDANNSGNTTYNEIRGSNVNGAARWKIGQISTSNESLYIYNYATDSIRLGTQGNGRLVIDSDGHITPGADATQDLGSASLRFANIYSADLQLSNEGSANEVDGTWGQYTIQEGEDDLFLINRRSGKKYKFMLQEVN